MRTQIDGKRVFASTGGKEPQDGQQWLIFLHGAGASHLLWNQQTRALAYDGWNVLAPDLPGHNHSQGPALETVEKQGDWLIALMDGLGIETATIIGHSMGALIGLYLADTHPKRVERLVFVGTAAAIPVNPKLIESAEIHEPMAKSSMTAWALGASAHRHDNAMPGFTNIGMGLRTMDLNASPALAADLKACAAFEGGLEIAANIDVPSLCILAGKDRMTPLKAGRKLAGTLPNNTLKVIEESGHTIPSEYPKELVAHMREFLGSLA